VVWLSIALSHGTAVPRDSVSRIISIVEAQDFSGEAQKSNKACNIQRGSQPLILQCFSRFSLNYIPVKTSCDFEVFSLTTIVTGSFASVPPELIKTWNFSFRTALHPRAPTFA
jgi:hypothetical protein